jgi:hypothetical protein
VCLNSYSDKYFLVAQHDQLLHLCDVSALPDSNNHDYHSFSGQQTNFDNAKSKLMC